MSRPRHPRWLCLLATMLLATAVAPSAATADPRLEAAQERRFEVQARLDELLTEINAAEVEQEALEARLTELAARGARQQAAADRANAALAAQAQAAYQRGIQDPTLSILSSRSIGEAAKQARLLGLLAEYSQSQYEDAAAAKARTRATAAEVESTVARLRERRSELDAAQDEAERLVAEATAEEQRVREKIAAEEAARRAEEERRAREAAQASRARNRVAASRSQGAGFGAAAVAEGGGGRGVSCPVGQPHHYTDTWGAPRSGGRRHKGTDILAPYGTPIYAYESGVITRTSGNRLGGISLYLRGDSGATYYYTHLAGYAKGISEGVRVSAGQHIARNGDTGNARGIPHLHFEVAPGDGGVNPYPYVVRACG